MPGFDDRERFRKGFNVLDPTLPLKKRLFIEASAGTGKTFAMENLMLRFLIEEGIPIEQILMVTFTKKATLEIKTRIHEQLKKMLFQGSYPPYIKDQITARKRVHKAYISFDQARIFTMHSFCYRALQEHAFEAGFPLEAVQAGSQEDPLKAIVKDYLRTEAMHRWTPQQLDRVLNHHQKDMDALLTRLVHYGRKTVPLRIEKGEFFSEIERLKGRRSIQAPLLLEDLVKLAPLYSGMCGKDRQLKSTIGEGLHLFCNQFEGKKADLTDSPLLQMVPENRLKKNPPLSLHYPGLLEEMQERLIPLMQRASDELILFSEMAEGVRGHLSRVIEKEELFFFDDLLRHMQKNSENPLFLKKLQQEYQAVLIDEFQDTDPLQWKIFSALFLTYPVFFYLVGDPKQSIYRFRHADLYTYQKAKRAFGEENIVTLEKNFRSDPPLIAALNALFSQAGELFSLPRTQEAYHCPPVEPGSTHPPFVWKDGKKPLHFCKGGEEKELFLFTIAEIEKLHQEEKLPYSSFAVLVKDKNQLTRFSQMAPFPLCCVHNRTLFDSYAATFLQHLLHLMENPADERGRERVCMSPLFGYQLREESFFLPYKERFEKRGLLALFHALMEEQRGTLFTYQEGELFYHDLLQLSEGIVSETDGDRPLSAFYRLIREERGADKWRARPLDGGEGVHVMTIHVSKGLEFDVVFPLGLILPSICKRELVQCHEKGAFILSNDPHSLHQEEEKGESARLLYVAFTRAKKRLYIPYLEKENGSPLSLFLKKLELPHFLEQQKEHVSWFIYEEAEQKTSQIEEPPSLITPEHVLPSFSSVSIRSFSSLTTYHPHEIASPSPLPAGVETGLLLHKILEKIPFHLKTRGELRGEISPFLRATFLEPFEELITEMLYEIFHAPLPLPEGSFSLSQIDPRKMRREMEFLYPTERPTGFLKGFIDLFFEHEGNYYIVDWKSNDLGVGGEEYVYEALERVVKFHQYDLQAEIYKEAIKRYLEIFNMPSPKGVFFSFLRGWDSLTKGFIFL